MCRKSRAPERCTTGCGGMLLQRNYRGGDCATSGTATAMRCREALNGVFCADTRLPSGAASDRLRPRRYHLHPAAVPHQRAWSRVFWRGTKSPGAVPGSGRHDRGDYWARQAGKQTRRPFPAIGPCETQALAGGAAVRAGMRNCQPGSGSRTGPCPRERGSFASRAACQEQERVRRQRAGPWRGKDGAMRGQASAGTASPEFRSSGTSRNKGSPVPARARS